MRLELVDEGLCLWVGVLVESQDAYLLALLPLSLASLMNCCMAVRNARSFPASVTFRFASNGTLTTSPTRKMVMIISSSGGQPDSTSEKTMSVGMGWMSCSANSVPLSGV
jgi:hypothetical protein